MTIAKIASNTALQNIYQQLQWKSFEWIVPDARKLSRYLPLIVCILVSNLFLQILYDADYEDHDVTARGINIFTWLPKILGIKRDNFAAEKQETNEIFPRGLASIEPTCIRQQSLMDCKFLAGISSMARGERGKKTIYQAIHQNENGTFTVKFPGIATEPITVEALTPEEKHYYSRAVGARGESYGQWLPILEKAYGTYRIAHQGLWKANLRYLKHVILDFKFSSRPALAGFGASYGAIDDLGAQVLGGGDTLSIETSSFELGEFGLGKGYVTLRQLQSWFDRVRAEKEIQEEQHKALCDAMTRGSIAVASTEISGEAARYHLFPGHAYGVLNYEPISRMITLKDPLCADIWERDSNKARDGVDDGFFKISLADFNVLFSRLRVQTRGVNE